MMRNVMEVVIVTENDMSALKGRDGEQAVLVFRSIAKWMAEMRSAKAARFVLIATPATTGNCRKPSP